jgi:hypothetical protein
LGILLPKIAKEIESPIWNVKRAKATHVVFVEFEEVARGRQVVVDNVEDFAINASNYASQGDRLGTIVNVGQGNVIGASEVKKETERVDADSSVYPRFSWAIHNTRTHDNRRQPALLLILHDKLVLLQFSITIRIPSQQRVRLEVARFIKDVSALDPSV